MIFLVSANTANGDVSENAKSVSRSLLETRMLLKPSFAIFTSFFSSRLLEFFFSFPLFWKKKKDLWRSRIEMGYFFLGNKNLLNLYRHMGLHIFFSYEGSHVQVKAWKASRIYLKDGNVRITKQSVPLVVFDTAMILNRKLNSLHNWIAEFLIPWLLFLKKSGRGISILQWLTHTIDFPISQT